MGRRKDLGSRIVPIVAHDPSFGNMSAKRWKNIINFIGPRMPKYPGWAVFLRPMTFFRFAEMLRCGGELDGVRSPVTRRQ